MEKKIIEVACKTFMVDVSQYPLNFLIFPHRLTGNSYVGCEHNCVYCYARWYCKQNEIKVKTNSPEILQKELQNRINRGKHREPLCLGSISDPYQPIEAKYQLTRKTLQVCEELSYPLIIVTKSALIQKDIDILSSLAQRNFVAVNLTITPLANKVLKKLEPHAPSNRKRLETIEHMTKAGIPCNLYLSPIFPLFSDELIDDCLEKSALAGAKCCSAIPLKIRPVIWHSIKQFFNSNLNLLIKELDELYLTEQAPDLVTKYYDLYFKKGTKDLSGYRLPELSYRRKMMEHIANKCKQLGMCFTSEEFLDLWTTPYSDCVNIDGWNAPTAYDILKKIKNQPKASKEQIIELIKKQFILDDKWVKLANKHWDKIELFS
ncbi:MAG: radical SAM protein [Candidatus Bathyarchaeota archaeon]|nr:radical SAM protein [Candidatus Bathyarchaeota archaeon]